MNNLKSNNMKTTLKILIAFLTIVTLWQYCESDIVNMVFSFISIPLLILGYSLLTTLENETEE